MHKQEVTFFYKPILLERPTFMRIRIRKQLELLENMSYATFFPPFLGGNFCHRNQKIANRIFPMI